MRDPFTYRAARRNAWHEYRQTMRPRVRQPFASLNVLSFNGYAGTPPVAGHVAVAGRSKYQPHQGKQEMARRVRQLG